MAGLQYLRNVAFRIASRHRGSVPAMVNISLYHGISKLFVLAGRNMYVAVFLKIIGFSNTVMCKDQVLWGPMDRVIAT